MTPVTNGGVGPQPDYTPPKTADGKIDYDRIAAESKRDPSLGFYRDQDEKRADEERRAVMIENLRAAEEAGLEKDV
ncbi:hypothetical protein GVO57_10445 [Sphingomonas changnyeongensis]|uniref:Uncharacterized protein n=1 Tax=Sphingomonas changnyeongensis TaxID=2698679 RepID=A0A7Z2NWJ9_9SPHN|nr:hypothetical protein [Sphingomonas changnyeongensis]QHL91158.1 hypothetical protein GVO57_10445 [Sphingomonas changnyeongensis]